MEKLTADKPTRDGIYLYRVPAWGRYMAVLQVSENGTKITELSSGTNLYTFDMDTWWLAHSVNFVCETYFIGAI